ncbi:MAG: ribose-phosphate pyrophosphokinase [Planctomycetota bacterium]|nr:ribose-phosphate pyrophosphokinase [Planctomycetota bacterium]
MSKKERMLVFSGNANKQLATSICSVLGMILGDAEVSKFPDGEIQVKVNDDVRGAHVFVVQSTCCPVNDSLMELLILVDCLRRASAEYVTAVIPYFGYARQDRKAEGRVPITAKLVANMISAAGTNRVVTIDLHAAQIQGFFDIPVDHLFAAPVMIEYLSGLQLGKLSVVSTDVGGVKMARAYAKRLGAGLAIVDKRRMGPQETDVAHVIGEVEGQNVVVVDDMMATGGSVVEAVKVLKQRGARDVYVCATHAVLAGNAVAKLEKAEIKQLIISDTIPLYGKERPFMKVLSVARLVAEAMRRIHNRESVSSLFL